jgi:hypothetical protein
MMAVDGKLARGSIDEETLRRSTASLVGHLRQARTRNLRAPFFKAEFGAAPSCSAAKLRPCGSGFQPR